MNKLGRFSDGLAICDGVLMEQPDHRWATYYKLDALLGLSKYKEVLDFVDDLESKFSDIKKDVKVAEAVQTAWNPRQLRPVFTSLTRR